MGWGGHLGNDLRYAWRGMRANPLFSVVAMLTLALGIGANTAIFSVMNAVVLRALPVRDPARLFYLRLDGNPPGSNTGNGDSSFSEPVFEQLRADKQAFADVMAYVPLGINKIAVRAGNAPHEAAAEMVSGNFFSGLGVRAERGRLLTGADEREHTATAVLSYAYWSSQFGADANAVGKKILVTGVPLTIVGVAGPAFTGLEGDGTDIWIPLQTSPKLNAWGMQSEQFYKAPTWWCLLLAARLAPGVSKRQAEAAANPVFQRAAYAPVGGKPKMGEKPSRLHLLESSGLTGYKQAFEKPLTMLLATVGVILLIACGNVSMLLAARNAARRREFSVRLALGGSRGRLFRQLLAETLLLVSAGAVLGWMLGFAGTEAIAKWSQTKADLSPDWRVLLFTLAVSMAAGLISGLAPTLGLSKLSIGEALKTSAATGFRDQAKSRTARVTTTLQVALCLVLLLASVLLVQTLRNLEQTDLGFQSNGLLVFGVTPHVTGDEQVRTFYRTLTDRLRSLRRVESMTLLQNRLGSGWSNNTGAVIDGRSPQDGRSNQMRWNGVGPDYFKTLGIPLQDGREFSDSDNAKAGKVAVVNRTFANRFFGNRQALGHTASFSEKTSFTIVGIAPDSKYTDVREEPTPMAYFPYMQLGEQGTLHVELRTRGNPQAVIPEVQKTLSDFGPDLAMLQPTTQRQQFEDSFSTEKLIARLSLFFGLLAVVMVATGLYGTIAYNVNRRTSELGIRMALGAEKSHVLWMVLREGLSICLAGIVVGLPLAYFSSRLLASSLYGLEPMDPLSLAMAMAGIVIVTTLACLIPARRAANINPTIALRNE